MNCVFSIDWVRYPWLLSMNMKTPSQGFDLTTIINRLNKALSVKKEQSLKFFFSRSLQNISKLDRQKRAKKIKKANRGAAGVCISIFFNSLCLSRNKRSYVNKLFRQGLYWIHLAERICQQPCSVNTRSWLCSTWSPYGEQCCCCWEHVEAVF